MALADWWSWIELNQWYKQVGYNEWFYVARRMGDKIDYVIIKAGRMEYWLNAPTSWIFDADSYIKMNNASEATNRIDPHVSIINLFNPKDGSKK